MPSNFRTYEAQSRLLAAVVAAHPGLKLNFKAITQHFGSDVTESIIRHRFRPVKMQADAIRKAVAEGKDAKDLSDMFRVSEKEIAKYFGESTPQGIEFQFRAIRKDAKSLRDAVDSGASPLTVRRQGGSAKRKAPSAGLAAAVGSAKKTAAKRLKVEESAALCLSNEEDSSSFGDDVDYDQLDLTPSSTPRMPARTVPASTPAAAVPLTPGTLVPDSTPGLSTGTTPSDAATPDGEYGYPRSAVSSVATVRPTGAAPAVRQTPQRAHQRFYEPTVIDDDDDDDGVFIIDTPSKMPRTSAVPKMPKIEPGTAHDCAVAASFASIPSSAPTPDLAQSWHTQGTSQSHGGSFAYDGASSWLQHEDPFASVGDSFSHSMAHSSFYDNDGAI